jgi:hypothetical protein
MVLRYLQRGNNMKRTTATITTTLIATVVIAFGTLTANIAAAQVKDPVATPRIDQRQANQQARINKGVANGKITPAEQARLQGQQNQIAANKATAKADGVVTKQERKALKRQQNEASHAIARKKQNARAL